MSSWRPTTRSLARVTSSHRARRPRVLRRDSIEALRCRLIVGAANDVLAERSCAERLADRGIVYVPDFVSNAGGVLQIHAERAGWDADRLDLSLAAVGRRTFDLLDEAAATGALPLHVGRAVGLGPVGASRHHS